MPSSIAIMNARNFVRDGGAFGDYIATSYELQGERVLLVALCNECGAKNRIPWSHVCVEARTPGTVLCVNRERHKAVAKPAAPDWQRMTDAQFRAYVKSLPSDQYLAMTKNAAFAARDAENPNKYLDRKEAIERKERADKQACMEPHRKMFVNAWHAYDNQGLQPPFHRLEGWLALSEAERQGIIKRFSLDTVDHTPNLDRMLGRA
jgi:hypothetical protein